MPTTEELRNQIRAGRGATLDWLSEEDPVAQIAETMVAFANSGGGLIVVGAAHSTVIGVKDLSNTSDRLIEAALSTDPPLIIPLPKVVTIKDKSVVIAQIPSGMPHIYTYEGRYLQRENEENVPLNPRDLRLLMLQRGEISFETNIAQDASLDDINWDKASEYASNLSGFSEQDVQQILLKRGCLSRHNQDLYPTNAGILLFGKDPQRFIVGSDISAVRFASATMGDTFNRHDLNGTLPDQIRRAETFLIDHLRKEVILRGTMKHQESYEYPMEAARELLVNAVAHRDYSIRGDNIRLFIFSNRMEIYSPGGLSGPMTLQNLREERFSRNPVIVQVLADMSFIEKLGYGLDRVLDLMSSQKMPAPEFQERGGGFQVVMHRAMKAIVIEEIEEAEDSIAIEQEVSTINFNGIYEGQPVNIRQEAALLFLHTANNSRITNGDLKELFSDVHPETLRRDLADLVNREILVKLGQKRGSYYRLNKIESLN
jgi:ATP-dependent DNA helicase RecG